ncbi:MAG: hypothetical protein WBP29_12090 [Candidatus Zixiibacteriota bacterium]
MLGIVIPGATMFPNSALELSVPPGDNPAKVEIFEAESGAGQIGVQDCESAGIADELGIFVI